MPYSQLKQKRSTTIKSGLSFKSLRHPYGIDSVKLPTSKVHRLLSIFSMSSLRGVTLPVSRAWKLECSFYGACSSSSWSFTSVGDTCSSCDLKLKRNYCYWSEQVTFTWKLFFIGWECTSKTHLITRVTKFSLLWNAGSFSVERREDDTANKTPPH